MIRKTITEIYQPFTTVIGTEYNSPTFITVINILIEILVLTAVVFIYYGSNYIYIFGDPIKAVTTMQLEFILTNICYLQVIVKWFSTHYMTNDTNDVITNDCFVEKYTSIFALITGNKISHQSDVNILDVISRERCKIWHSMQSVRTGQRYNYPDSKVHGANMGPTWVLLAPDGPHVGPMNLAIRVMLNKYRDIYTKKHFAITILWARCITKVC